MYVFDIGYDTYYMHIHIVYICTYDMHTSLVARAST